MLHFCLTIPHDICVFQIKTPVMIMLGEVDKRVPPKQGHELYRALKARNVPVRYN